MQVSACSRASRDRPSRQLGRARRPSGASLGRAFAGGTPNITVNLIEPGTLYGNRVNQLDLRIAKNCRFGGKRTF